jgi:hypothetical protein
MGQVKADRRCKQPPLYAAGWVWSSVAGLEMTALLQECEAVFNQEGQVDIRQLDPACTQTAGGLVQCNGVNDSRRLPWSLLGGGQGT